MQDELDGMYIIDHGRPAITGVANEDQQVVSCQNAVHQQRKDHASKRPAALVARIRQKSSQLPQAREFNNNNDEKGESGSHQPVLHSNPGSHQMD
jgi:hypothetical protein